MKIVFVVHKYPPFSTGGTEVYCRNLAAELTRCGHDVVVYFRADGHDTSFAASDEVVDGIRVRRVSVPQVGWRSFPLIEFYHTFLNRAIERDFASFLARERPDVVHFQHVMALSARLIAIARAMGYPTVLTLHDYWFLCSNAQLIWPDSQVCKGKCWDFNCSRCALARLDTPLASLLRPCVTPLLWLRDQLVLRAAMRADGLIAPSRFLMQQYIKAGFHANRLIYLENGTSLDRIRQHAHQPSADGRLRFTYLGSLAWQKGVHIVVQAFRDIPAQRAFLRICGDPTVFPEYASRLLQVADPDNTVFVGPVPNEQVGSILAETDVLVVPSLWYENSPLVIQEAYAARVPVVASRIGALTEKVRDGVDGLLCTAGDVQDWRRVLLSIVDHPERLTSLRAHLAQPVDLQHHANLVHSFYLSISQADEHAAASGRRSA
jgi:glycosyltransferase involved in cell wall biosynthesis